MPAFDWNDLRIAAAIAETGTLTGAAKLLGLSQPTVSRRLTALEVALGVVVFVRHSRGYSLSSAGTRLVAPIADIAARIERVAADARWEDTDPIGLVRVATTEVNAQHLLERVLPRLRTKHRELVVEIVASHALADVAMGEVDVAVRFQKPEGAELVARRLGTMKYALWASKSYLERHSDPMNVGGLVGHEMVVPSGELARGPEAAFLAEHGQQTITALRANSMPALVAAAAAGIGMAVLPVPVAAGAPALVRVLALPQIPERGVWLVSHRDARRLARVRVVADAVAAELSARLRRA